MGAENRNWRRCLVAAPSIRESVDEPYREAENAPAVHAEARAADLRVPRSRWRSLRRNDVRLMRHKRRRGIIPVPRADDPDAT